MLRPAVSHPLSLLLLVTALVTFLIQSGELGTSDTAHRLQVTHSLWTGEPQVFPYDYPDFGLHGRGGRLYASYGIGQSLLILPADLASTAASHLPLWRSYGDSEADPTRTVVTVEGSRPSAQRANRKVPDVCQGVSVACCGPFALNKALGFRTGWQTGN